jgi:hypothetical protein
MKFRKLRITFSALCAVLCIALIALWVQSHYWHVFLSKRLATCTVALQANHGELGIWSVSPSMAQTLSRDTDWDIGRLPLTHLDLSQLTRDDPSTVEFFGFRYADLPPVASALFVPFWALLLPVAAAGALPWIKWRIGWRSAISSVCVLATMVLIACWIRSYKWMDITDRSSAVNVCSMNGQLFVGETFMIMGSNTLNPMAPVPDSHLGICSLRHDKFDLVALGGGIALPYWLIVLVTAPLAAVPWLRFRFSLRTMLVATALISIVLCLVAFALRP